MQTHTLDLDDSAQERLSALFGALASTTRRAILARLALGEATVNELAEPFDLTLPAVSKHLKVLDEAGLIIRGRRAQFRPCTINPDALRLLAAWTEHYRELWDGRLDRLDDYLGTLSADQAAETTSQEQDDDHR